MPSIWRQTVRRGVIFIGKMVQKTCSDQVQMRFRYCNYKIHEIAAVVPPCILSTSSSAQLSIMNARKSFFETLSQDELARVVRYIESNTLLSLLLAKDCLFASVVHLVISNLKFDGPPGIHFHFDSSTICIGIQTYRFSLVKSLFRACEGLLFVNVSGYFFIPKVRKDHKQRKIEQTALFTQILAPYLAPYSTVALTLDDHDIQVIDAIDKKFLRSVSNIVIESYTSKFPSSPLNMGLFREVGRNIKVFYHHGSFLSYFENIWEILGATLEKVTIESEPHENSEWVHCIRQLRIHCRKLVAIRLREDKYNRTSISEEDEPARMGRS